MILKYWTILAVLKVVQFLLLAILTKEDVIKEIKHLDVRNVSQENDIPTNLIKEYPDIFPNFRYESFNNMTDVYILQGLKNSKKNYRPVSILQNMSKIYKRCLLK